MDSTISTTFLHTITFLLAPLSSHYPSPILDTLHLALLSSFSHLDIATHPQTLLLSPTAPPPQSIAYALQALQGFPVELRVHWADWMLLLGNGNQLMVTIFAGCVQATVRDVTTGIVSTNTVWNAALQTRTPSPWGTAVRSRSSAPPSSSESSGDSESSRSSSPTAEIEDIVAVEAAENVLNDDDEMVFQASRGLPQQPVVIKAPKVNAAPSTLSAAAPEWYPAAIGTRPGHVKTPSMASVSSAGFNATPNKMAPVGTKRGPHHVHSRSSSRSSTMSSAPSLISSYSTNSSSTASTINTAALANSLAALAIRSKTPSTVKTHSTGGSISLVPTASTASSSSPVPPSPTPSDISDSVDATFYLDATKDQQAVTEYECGKVGVLTGAVMLGVPKGPKAVKVIGNKSGMRRY
ncbi:hypothetical protein FRC04_011802 [Tulasnella sp. 424]|nr:hypothetical protein FRC04_011802 [Tulasnella sp. 424]KAG8978146.1 hypothetical protein FRC05_011262 [Tulasnella sp. 425]